MNAVGMRPGWLIIHDLFLAIDVLEQNLETVNVLDPRLSTSSLQVITDQLMVIAEISQEVPWSLRMRYSEVPWSLMRTLSTRVSLESLRANPQLTVLVLKRRIFPLQEQLRSASEEQREATPKALD